MADEYFIFDGHTVTNERVARNLAPRSNFGTSLNFHKAADPGFFTDLASIEIHEAEQPDISAKFDIRGNPQAFGICFYHIEFSAFLLHLLSIIQRNDTATQEGLTAGQSLEL
jgi:hypothetical protein